MDRTNGNGNDIEFLKVLGFSGCLKLMFKMLMLMAFRYWGKSREITAFMQPARHYNKQHVLHQHLLKLENLHFPKLASYKEKLVPPDFNRASKEL